MSTTGPKKRCMYWFYEIYNQKNSTAIKPSRRASKISIPPNISEVINKGLLFSCRWKNYILPILHKFYYILKRRNITPPFSVRDLNDHR